MGKKKTVDIHFKRRCEERLGFIPDVKILTKLIQNAKIPFVERQSNRITKWRWINNGKSYILVYDKERKQIVTILFDGLTI